MYFQIITKDSGMIVHRFLGRIKQKSPPDEGLIRVRKIGNSLRGFQFFFDTSQQSHSSVPEYPHETNCAMQRKALYLLPSSRTSTILF